MIIDSLKEKYVKDIANIEKQNFSDPWSENAIREELDNPVAMYFVALEADCAVGYIGMHIIAGEAYITNIAVADGFKRRGIGKSLMTAATEYCRENKCRFITLEVRSGNSAAIGLYNSFGFEKLGTRRAFYTKPTEDADIMTLYFRE